MSGRRGLDGWDSAYHWDIGLELGAKCVEGVYGTGVACHHQDIGLVGDRRASADQSAGGYVVGSAWSPGHAVWIWGEHKIGIWSQPVQFGRGCEQAESGVDQSDSHEPTVWESASVSFAPPGLVAGARWGHMGLGAR